MINRWLAAAPLSPVGVGVVSGPTGTSWRLNWRNAADIVGETTVIDSVSNAVQNYMRRGWSIIPIRPGDKRPLVEWDQFQRRRAGEADVCDWFRTCPDAGIGIVTGAVSGLVVLDVDVRHGGDAALQRLEREHGRLPTTLECRTGGGGHHLYFAHPGRLVRNKVGLAAGIDLRADGGYVVAPPSLHASGLRYVWVDGRAPDDIQCART